MKTFIIDLDNTLLDTERFAAELHRSIKPSISYYYWTKTYRIVMSTYESGYNYTPQHHAKIISEHIQQPYKKVLHSLYVVIKKLPIFLYVDSLPLLKDLKTTKNKLILLTYGNIEFQEEKIKLLKISKYFDQIIISPKKKDEIKLPIKSLGADTIFINDNPYEFAALKIKYPKAIFLRKVNRFKFSKVMYKEFPPFKSLGEIHQYLKNNLLI